MCKKLFYLIACALLLSAASGVQAAVLEITPDAPEPGALDIANFVGALTDAENIGTEDDTNNPPYWNDWCTYVAHDRGGQGQTFITGDSDVVMTGVWVKHVTYSGADPDQTWYQMQAGAELELRITDPAAAGTDAFVLAGETYVVTGEEENALPADTTNDQTGTSLWLHITLDAPVALAANTEYGFDLTSLSDKAGVMFFETDGINDRAEGGNPYEAGTAYTSGVNPDDHGDDLNGANDNNMVIAPGDHVFVVELEAPAGPTIVWVTDAYDDNADGEPDDLEWKDILEAEGYNVDYQYNALGDGHWRTLDDAKIAALNAADLIIVSRNSDSGNYNNDDEPTQWNSITTPIILSSTHIVRSSRWMWVDSTTILSLTPTMVLADGTEIPGINADVGPASFIDAAAGNGTITSTGDGLPFVIEWEAGVEYYDGAGQTAGGPRVFFTAGTQEGDGVGRGEMNLAPEALAVFLDVVKGLIPVKTDAPVHSYTFEDGTASDSVGSADGTLVGDATVVDGQLVLDGDGDWMDMPGDVIAMNTYPEVTIEIWLTSVEGGNTGFHMVTAFGEEGTGDNPGYGYKYICITPARGDDVSRAMIQTVSMDNDPWSEETGVSDVIEHDDGLPHHMVCTVDDTELVFYIDGVLIGTAALDPPGNSVAGLGTDVAHIGKGVYGVDPLWAGSVDELNIYDRALSLTEVQAKYAAGPFKGLVHSYTFEDGTTNDSVGSADGTLVGDAAVVGGSLVLDGDGDWMEMPGDVIAMNTYPEVTVETWFTSVEGGNTGFHMLAAFGEEATGVLDWAGYKYLFITPARGDDVSRAAIQTNSMDDSPWDDETGVSATVEHDDGLEHHFVATVDAANITFYIDGELIGSEPLAPGNEVAGIGQAVAYLGKGVYPADPLWTGSVEQLNIYNRALSLDEVQANYTAGPQKEGEVPIDPGTDGLMLHLPLDTASRGSTKDNSVNGLDGTVVGDPVFVEGIDILAIELDGVDDRVEIADDPAFDAMSEKFTISAWIKLSAEGITDRRPIISKELEPDPDGRGWEFKVNEGQLAMQLYSPVEGEGKLTITGTTTLDADQWYHVVGIYQADGPEQFYINGQLDYEQELVTALQSNDSPANIGAYIWSLTGYQKYFAGLIDDVKVYNRALSILEVQFLAGM